MTGETKTAGASAELERLRRQVAELKAENQRLQRGFALRSGDYPVSAPEPLGEHYQQAARSVREHFATAVADPERGTIEIGAERYVLVRAAALSVDFLGKIVEIYADRGDAQARAIARELLFDLAHTVGINDARAFATAKGLTTPQERLAAGPAHFAFSGWATVRLRPESNPVLSDDFCLVYDHGNSFEASSWIASGRRPEMAVCVMNAGYSSGWCEASFALELTAVEVLCCALGDPTCTFVMAPPHRIGERMREHFGKDCLTEGTGKLHVPTYFDRKRAEEERERFILQLEQALARVKTLRGLIPICAACKKVRDDAGYWHQVEGYIKQHSEAEFSHGICPECRVRLYGKPDDPGEPDDER